MARCPFARWNPVKFADRLDSMSGPPRAAFVHTNGGGPNLTSWFDQEWDRTQQRIGCTFQVFNDGSIDQLCETDQVIYAQFSASEWCVSIETEDDNNSQHPWTPQQLATLGRLLTWLHETHGIPIRLMQSPTDSGISYHQQFAIYNQSGHDCPGPTRVNQLLHTVIPRLGGGNHGQGGHIPAPVNPLPLPWMKFDEDTRTWQRQMLLRGWNAIGNPDGVYGDRSRTVCSAFQHDKGLKSDGIVGPATWASAWASPITR